MTRIGIAGVMGRMGRALVAEVLEREGCEFAGGTEYASHPAIGAPIRNPVTGEPTGHHVSPDGSALFEACDVVIDFTSPDAIEPHLKHAREHGAALVIGTTGLSAQHHAALDKAAQDIALVQSANMSLGVNLLARLVEQAARALGDDWDIEVLEMHHRHKIDAPSGTALLLGKAAAEGRGVDLQDNAVRSRDGITGARPQGKIGFATLRGGNVAGEHSVIFATDDERVELSHKAADRRIFARGAVTAARWVAGRDKGRYSMADVLGL